MLRPVLDAIQQRPRLDLTLLGFALVGLLVALVLPPSHDPAAKRDSYVLAIAAGDNLRLEQRKHPSPGAATHHQNLEPLTGAVVAPVARVLACRNVLSVGAIEIGSACNGDATERIALGD